MLIGMFDQKVKREKKKLMLTTFKIHRKKDLSE